MNSFNPTNGEREFDAFVRAKLLEFDESPECLIYEPDRFSLSAEGSGLTAGAVTPDFRWELGETRRNRLAKRLSCPLAEIPEVVYLELSSADRYDTAVKLPRRARRKNQLYSFSRKEYVPPDVYLNYKNTRLEIARQRHEIVIVLLCWADQLAIFKQPEKLEEMVAAEIARRPSPTALTS